MTEPRVLRDLRVLRPEPRGVVVYGDPPVSYPVRSIIDMKHREVHRLLELDNPVAGQEAGMLEQSARIGVQLQLMVPTLPDAILEEMTFRERVDFQAACLQAAPAPLAESLARLLVGRALPCEEPCEHVECPPLRELWAMKEKLTEANPMAPAPALPASEGSSTASGSLTT